jgi:hypothetical protein
MGPAGRVRPDPRRADACRPGPHLAGRAGVGGSGRASDRAVRAGRNAQQPSGPRALGAIFALAVASRTAAEPLRGQSLRTAAAALLAWAGVYRPAGNPVDEWFFLPLLQAADLIAAGLEGAGRRTVLDWVAEFAQTGDTFYAAKREQNQARANNWMARRLLIRTVLPPRPG